MGNTVIADSVNPWELTRKEWNGVAEEIGARYIDVEVVCVDKKEHQRRVESRGSSVPGLKAPTWEEVLKREYQPWTSTRVQLDTSGKSSGQSLEELVSALSLKGIPD